LANCHLTSEHGWAKIEMEKWCAANFTSNFSSDPLHKTYRISGSRNVPKLSNDLRCPCMPLKQFSAFSAPAAEAMWPTFHDSKVTEFPRKPAKKPVRSWVKQPVKVSVDHGGSGAGSAGWKFGGDISRHFFTLLWTPTVEILHPLMVYPIHRVSTIPNWWCRISQPSTVWMFHFPLDLTGSKKPCGGGPFFGVKL
jgi:hypothetical protein